MQMSFIERLKFLFTNKLPEYKYDCFEVELEDDGINYDDLIYLCKKFAGKQNHKNRQKLVSYIKKNFGEIVD